MTEAQAGSIECYSGHSYAVEPRTVVREGQRLAVVEVESRWRTPAGPAFRVRTDAGPRFDLFYDEEADRWAIRSLE